MRELAGCSSIHPRSFPLRNRMAKLVRLTIAFALLTKGELRLPHGFEADLAVFERPTHTHVLHTVPSQAMPLQACKRRAQRSAVGKPRRPLRHPRVLPPL